MAILLAAVLIVLSAGVLIFPFLKHRQPAARYRLGHDVGKTDSEMESLLEDMRLLNLDYRSGNIPDDLYQEQFQAYRLQAASHLRQQAEADPTSADLELEQEILMARLSSQAQVGPETPEATEATETPESSESSDTMQPEEPAPDLREDLER